MAGRIRRSDIDELRSRINIGDIVGDYVTLKRAGVDSLMGLCPFHEERNPSFHVRPRAGRYHCFGCGEDGDVYTFLQRMDHLGFAESVERLAARIGFELHYEEGGGRDPEQGNRARLLAANSAAEEFFRAQLREPAAQLARDFLGGRGFDPAAAEHFAVGYAPDSFSALGDHLKRLGFTAEELLAAGLQAQSDSGRQYDRFRGRLVWPIRDVTGATVGFGARKLRDDDGGPKYLNTPETPVYQKSRVLYGLDLARRDIARSRQVVVVEGYTDVMAAHLAGVTTAVATCGTAFGVEHIKLIRRLLGDVANADVTGTGQVVFTFDPDEAGQRAASRAFAEEQRFAAQTFVAVAPDGLDPCDLRLKRGDDAVRALVAGRKPLFEFMIRRQLDAHDLETVEGRVAALRSAAPVVATMIRDRALQDGYVRNLAGWLGMDPREVARGVAAASRAPVAAPRRTDPRAPLEEEAPVAVRPSMTGLPTDPLTRSERDALMAVLQHPEAVGEELLGRLAELRFVNPVLSVVRDAVVAAQHAGDDGSGWVEQVAAQAPTEFESLVSQLAIAPIPQRPDHVAAYCRDVVVGIVDRDLLRQKSEVLGAMQRARGEGDEERSAELSREAARLEEERRRLRES